MIAFKNSLPLLQTGYCVISDYGVEWIERVLQNAADAAGVKLPFRDEIARAVLLYLERECPLHAVPLEYLFDRMRSMLYEVGLPLIAQNLRVQTPPVDIELDALAGQQDLPLFFYTELGRRLAELRRMGLNTYHFSGKKECSLLLGARRRACPTQQRALEELDAFLNRNLGNAG